MSIIANYKQLVNPALVRKGWVKSLPKYFQKRLPKEVAVISISAKESRRLNRLYRKKDKSTNVLSFRYDSEYGEILVCPEVIKKEARLAGNSLEYQMTWMIAHGMMHLGGVHHEQSTRDAENVEKLEGKILSRLLGVKLNLKSQILNLKN